MPYQRVLAGRSPVLTDLALLLMRVMMAVVFVLHGAADFFTPGFGVAALTEGFRGAGIPLPEVAAPFTVFGQFVGGLLFLAGALTRVLALAYVVMMLGAVFFVHIPEGGGFFNQGPDGIIGYEYPLTLAVFSVAFVLAGPGRFSVDRLLAGRAAGAEPGRASGTLVH